jgi:hypothetical protein
MLMRPKPLTWYQRFFSLIRFEMRWLTPGLGIKRWIIIFLAGATLIGLGLAAALLDIARTAPDSWWLPIFYIASLSFFDRTLRASDLWWFGDYFDRMGRCRFKPGAAPTL